MFVYVLNRRSNTKCKTENYHTAVLHWTNQSHISDNARKPCHRVNSLIGEDRHIKSISENNPDPGRWGWEHCPPYCCQGGTPILMLGALGGYGVWPTASNKP